MKNSEIIKDEFKKACEQIKVENTNQLNEVFRYFFIEGLKAAAKLKDDEL